MVTTVAIRVAWLNVLGAEGLESARHVHIGIHHEVTAIDRVAVIAVEVPAVVGVPTHAHRPVRRVGKRLRDDIDRAGRGLVP